MNPRKRRPRELRGATPDPDDDYVAHARKLGQEFAKTAAERFDEPRDELDFSIDSIRILDRVCRFSREAFDDALILRAGFYFAEMLRRAYRGKYRFDEKQQALALEVEGLSVFPIEKVRRVVASKEGGSLQDFLMVLAKKIAERRGHG